MSMEERTEKEDPFLGKYYQEMEDFGLKRLEIKEGAK